MNFHGYLYRWLAPKLKIFIYPRQIRGRRGSDPTPSALCCEEPPPPIHFPHIPGRGAMFTLGICMGSNLGIWANLWAGGQKNPGMSHRWFPNLSAGECISHFCTIFFLSNFPKMHIFAHFWRHFFFISASFAFWCLFA